MPAKTTDLEWSLSDQQGKEQIETWKVSKKDGDNKCRVGSGFLIIVLCKISLHVSEMNNIC